MKQKTKVGKLIARVGAGFTIFSLLAWSLPAGLAISLLPVSVGQEVKTVQAVGETATVTGTVVKPDGSVFGNVQGEGARVEIRPDGPGQGYEGDTGQGGNFTIVNVPFGTYNMTANVGSDSQYTSSAGAKVSVGSATVNVGIIKLTNPTLTGKVVNPGATTGVADTQVDIRSMDYMVNRGTRTDSNGVFKLGGLENGAYMLTARAPQGSQYSDSETSVTIVDKNTLKNLGNVALSTPNVIGRIVDPNGGVLSLQPGGMSVNVDIHTQDRTIQRNTATNSSGNFIFGTLPTGSYIISTNIGGSSNYTASTDKPVNVTQGTLLNVGDIRLSSPQITGTVKNPDGSLAQNAWVQAHNDNWTVQQGSNANNGSYSIGGLAPGTYKVGVNVPWGVSGVVAPDEKTVTITQGGAVQTINFQFSAATKFVRGTVKRANGTAITDARVEANRQGAHAEANTQSNGAYELSLGPGLWEIRVNPQMGPGMPAPDWIYSGWGEKVEFAENNAAENKTLNFTVQTSTSRVKGKVVKPDGTPLTNGHVDVRNQEGQGNGQPVNPDGTFSIPVGAGSYRINVWAGENSQFTFPEKNISVKENETIDIGTLKATAKNAHIRGKVVKKDGVTPVQGIRINANLDRAPGWSQSTSQSDGTFDLAVTQGRWHVNIDQGANASYVYSGEHLEADVETDNSIVSLGDIKLTYADVTIQGKLVDASGKVVLNVFGWAFARPSTSGTSGKFFGPGQEYGGGVDGQTGMFTIRVPSLVASTYTLGLHLPPDTDYSGAGEQNVAVVADGTYTKNITVKKNDSSVSGKLIDQNGNTLTSCNFRGDVFLNSEQGEWKGAEIKSDCTYRISVLGGKTYRMGYWIEPGKGFMEKPPSPEPIDVVAGQNLIKNITVTKANATITGRVLDPSGNGIRAFVFAGNWIEFEEGDEEFKEEDHFEKELFSGGETDSNGNFTINVLSGHRYEVNAGIPADKSDYMPPDMVEVDLTVATSANVILKLKISSGKMSGAVTINGAPVNHGFVHCWNPEGGFAGGEVRFGGIYTLNYTPGTWYCGADTFDGDKFYRSSEERIVIGGETAVTKNFELKASSVKVPQMMSVTVSDVTQSQTMTLDNGTQITIPAGALGESGSATVTATPTVDLTRTKTEQPFGVGYKLEATDSSGNAVTTFNNPVTITFGYTDEQLTEFGLDENALIGKYYDEESNTWKNPSGIIQDKKNNIITISTTHFTKFAIVASGAGAAVSSASTVRLLPQHPDGTLVKAKDGNSVYVLESGKKRPISNPTIFEARGYKWNEIVEISQAELNSYTTGTEINTYPDGYLLAGPDGRAYVISDGAKRYVTGPSVYTGLGYSWSNIINVSSAHLALYSSGSDLSTATTHPDGTLIKTATGGTVYRIDDGKKRAIESAAVFDANGYKWNLVVSVSQSTLDGYVTGAAIETYPSGKIIRDMSNNKIYVVDGATKRHIQTPWIFEDLGYKWNNVMAVSSAHAGHYTNGSNLTSVMVHPNGTLIKIINGGTVYLIEGGNKRAIVSPAIFDDQGFEWDDVVTVSQAEMNSYTVGNPVATFTDGNLLKGTDGKVYVISNDTKRYITGPSVFTGLGYSWSNVKSVSSDQLALYANGTDVSNSNTRPDGDTVKKNDGNLYTVISGALRHIPTPVFFERHGGDWNKVIAITDAEFNSATKGADLTNVMPDGTLLKGSNGKVYVVTNGTKRYFGGPDVFEALGYSWSNLISTTTTDLALYTDGSNVQ